MCLHWFCFSPIIAEVVSFIKREVLPTSRGHCPASMWDAGKVLQLTSNAHIANTAPVYDDSVSLHPLERQGAGGRGRSTEGASCALWASTPLTQPPWKERPLVKRGERTPSGAFHSTRDPSTEVNDGHFQREAEEAKIMFLIISAAFCKV